MHHQGDIELAMLFEYFKAMTHSIYIQILFIIIVLDVITGTMKAVKYRIVDSKTGLNGLVRHILIFFTAFTFGAFCRALGYRSIGVAVVTYFILNYVISLIENWQALDLPIPEFIEPYINQYRKEHIKKIEKMLEQREKKEE